MMALEDVPVIPAITRASRLPQPTIRPNAKPTPMLIRT